LEHARTIGDWILYGGPAVFLLWAAWLGVAALAEYLLALGGPRTPPLETEKAHGDARKATQAEAKGAASGVTAEPPWAKHGYRD
jgi:hypothetical protein